MLPSLMQNPPRHRAPPQWGMGGRRKASHVFLRRDVVGRPRPEWRVKNRAVGLHNDIAEFLRAAA